MLIDQDVIVVCSDNTGVVKLIQIIPSLKYIVYVWLVGLGITDRGLGRAWLTAFKVM